MSERHSDLDFFVRQLDDWFSENPFSLVEYPWRKAATPFMVLISEIMLRKTTREQVSTVFQDFVRSYDSPESLGSASLGELRSILKPLGLSLERSKQLHAIGSKLTKSRKYSYSKENLLELPGVGPYIADAVRCFAFGDRVIPIDGNVKRVLERYFASSKPSVTSEALLVRLQSGKIRTFCFALLDFAHAVCKARNPLCSECLLRRNCKYFIRQPAT